jgi:hypothetical protein
MQNLKLQTKKITAAINQIRQERYWEMTLNDTNWRRARTRSLIQLGGLIEKAGLLDDFSIELGADLQKNEDMKRPVTALFGALLEIRDMLHQDPASVDLWALKGYKHLGIMEE